MRGDTVHCDGEEFIIRFDGVNDGHDSDLLVDAAKQPVKHLGVPQDGNQAKRVKVLAALPTSRLDAVPFVEVVSRSGCTNATVNATLYHLKLDGILCWEALPGGRIRRPVLIYWRRV